MAPGRDHAIGGDGGAIYAFPYSGPWSLSDSLLRNNQAGQASGRQSVGGGYGGGIYFYNGAGEPILIQDSQFEANQAGSAYAEADAQNVYGGSGGGIYVDLGGSSDFRLRRVTMTDNQAGSAYNGLRNVYGGNGGGIATGGFFVPEVAVEASILSANRAGDAAGSPGASEVRGGSGGGVYNSDGILILTNSTLSGNRAGDSNYRGGNGGGAASLREYSQDEVHLYLHHTTVAYNQAGSGSVTPGQGGGVYNDPAASFYSANSLLAFNSAASGSGPECYSSMSSQDYNLLRDAADCNFSAQLHDQVGGNGNPLIDPLISPLGDYGGATPTHALQTGSPAMETIPNGSGGCGSTYTSDQRGFVRPRDGDGNGALACDSGSYEAGLVTDLLLSDSPDPWRAGDVFTASFTVTAAAPAFPGGVVTVTVDGNAGGPALSCAGALTGGSGQCRLQIDTPGVYTLTAVYGGDPLFDPSTASQLHTVERAQAAMQIAIAPSPSRPGEVFTIAVNIAPTYTTSLEPGGVVTISILVSASHKGQLSGSLVCTIFLENGAGSCPFSLPEPGSYPVTALYSGDAFFLPGQAAAPHTVQRGSTLLQLSDAPAPSRPGESFTASVGIMPDYSTTLVPGGMVTISLAGDGQAPSLPGCTTQLVNGAATCAFNLDLPALYTLTASYAGDANFTPNQAFTLHEVLPGASSIEIAAAPSPGTPGEPFTVSVSVAPSYQTALIPGGTVSITVPGATASCLISLAGDDVGSCRLTLQEAGSYTLAAAYSGDVYFTTSQANLVYAVQDTNTRFEIYLPLLSKG